MQPYDAREHSTRPDLVPVFLSPPERVDLPDDDFLSGVRDALGA
jgi:hypothetical protein